MHKKILNFIALIGIICISPVKASPVATVIDYRSSVWIQQNDVKTVLSKNSVVEDGDQIITSETGRVELLLWSTVALKLNANSAVTILAKQKSGGTSADNQPELSIQKGKACIKFISQPDTLSKFRLNIDNRLYATLRHHVDICAQRGDDMSSIKLRGGSVQITHSVDPNLIIISKAGTEFRIDDSGSYKLLVPGSTSSLTPQNDSSLTTLEASEEDVGSPAVDTNVDEIVATEAIDQKNSPGYQYTVYLFSTRSEEVAEQVNRKFQDAGHKTQIKVSENDSVTRYRIAVSGFSSPQAAKNYSDSIIGTLGIKDTWIGDVPSPAVDANVDEVMASEETATAKTEASGQENSPDYQYTLYLYSTRSEEVAEQVNREFQDAGHNTQIKVSENDSVIRYRIAVSGFSSAQAAKNYSDSIIGTLGIKDTWIGKE